MVCRIKQCTETLKDVVRVLSVKYQSRALRFGALSSDSSGVYSFRRRATFCSPVQDSVLVLVSVASRWGIVGLFMIS